MSVAAATFTDVVRDVSGGNTKVPQSAFLEAGAIPVIDQGQSFIAGYTDDEGSQFRSAQLPVVVFGDHTKAVKFIDFPFAMGADGVKVLKPGDGCDTKYLYHFLRYAKLPDAGYSRHFKFVKELKIPLLPLAEQRRIAAILDKVDALRAKRREAIAKLDQLLQSVFLDMFGDPVTNPKGWRSYTFNDLVKGSFRNGLSPSSKGVTPGEVLTLSAITGGAFDFSCRKAALFDKAPTVAQQVSVDTFLICRGNGNKSLVGAGVFPVVCSATVSFPDTMIGADLDKRLILPEYLQNIWRSRHVREQIERGVRTTNGTYKLNQRVLSAVTLPVPPVETQRTFSTIAERVKDQRTRVVGSSKQLDGLFGVLQHRAFAGALSPSFSIPHNE